MRAAVQKIRLLPFLEVVCTNVSTRLHNRSLSVCGAVLASGPDGTASRAGPHLERHAITLGPQVAPVILHHFPARLLQRSQDLDGLIRRDAAGYAQTNSEFYRNHKLILHHVPCLSMLEWSGSNLKVKLE